MAKGIFVSAAGLGNIIQSSSALYLASSKHEMDWLIESNAINDLELFKLPFVKNVFLNNCNKNYDFQLRGPFTSGKVYSRNVIRPRINYAQHIPESQVYYDMILQLGINAPLPEKTFINIGKHEIDVPNNTVAIYPGSKPDWAMKRWDKFDELAKNFTSVLLFGNDSDVLSTGEPGWMNRNWDWPSHAKRFQGSLQEVAYAISKCKMFIGNDGGLSHLAAATGIPTYIIFGPSSVIKNKPIMPNVKVIHFNLKCQPCQFRPEKWFTTGTIGCPFGMPCLRDLSVEYVLNCIN